MEERTIDVLLATYNGERFVNEQIESILNQTYKNINLIISDDCSTDATRQILSEYEKKDQRIKLYLQPNNLGVVKNIEFLLKQVKSKFYMLADQDDIWLPEKIEKTYKKLEDENADFVFSDLEVVDQNLKTMYPSFNDYMKLTRKIKKCINTTELNYLYNCVTGCTTLGKTEFINKILPLPANSKCMIHDYWIGIIMSLYGNVTYLDEKLIKYRQHGDNEVGTEKISHKMTKFEDVRNLFINVKLGIFESFVENNDRFPEKFQKRNTESLNYYKMIQNKHNFNFRKWGVYHSLYKNETFLYYLENFVIMNLPFFGEIAFKVRLIILKAMKKR